MEFTFSTITGLYCTCSAHVSWLVYIAHNCDCCDDRGLSSIKSGKLSMPITCLRKNKVISTVGNYINTYKNIACWYDE